MHSLSLARALSLFLSKHKENLDIAFDSPVLPVSDHACYQLSDKSDAEGEGAWSGQRKGLMNAEKGFDECRPSARERESKREQERAR